MCCYPVVMSVFLRYLGLVLAVLVLAIVFSVCGDGGCVACAHSDFLRSDRVDRFQTVWGKVLAAYSACAGIVHVELGSAASRARWLLTWVVPSSPLAERVTPLRM